MTDTNFTKDNLSIETLFNNGVCLTYNPYLPNDAFRYAKDKEKEYCKQNNVKHVLIKSKAELGCRGLTPDFHYFSNGILLHIFDETKEKEYKALQRVLKLLEIRRLPVHKIYNLQKDMGFFVANNYMRQISEYANSFYPYKEDFEIIPLPKIEDFVRECFANGNVLLTAHKDEKIDPKIRDGVALFADGRYYEAEEFRKAPARYNSKSASIFRYSHRKEYVFLHEDYVPKEYIAALYKEAEKYNWFITAQDMAHKFILSDTETQEMNRYIENLFQARKCLSVTNIEDRAIYFSADPDIDKYALFSDGLLVVGNNHPNPENSYFYDQMCRVYKDMKLRVEKVPEYYISAIYAALPKYQRSAKDIYMEMVKERAKKLKSALKITHHEALDLSAKIGGWDDFKSIKIEDESHARGLIGEAKWRKNLAKDSILEEYKSYLRQQKS